MGTSNFLKRVVMSVTVSCSLKFTQKLNKISLKIKKKILPIRKCKNLDVFINTVYGIYTHSLD